MTSCYGVFNYWNGKYITESGEVSNDDGAKIVENEYLPCCWACGEPVNRKDIFSWDKYDKSVEELWKDKKVNATLQRAHIIAKQFGGPDDPNNLFLLCPDCHYESPDTKNKAVFFRWVYRKKQRCSCGIDVLALKLELEQEIKARGYDVEEFCRDYFDGAERVDMKNAMEECGLHGSRIVPASVMGVFVDAAERKVIGIRRKKISNREKELMEVTP